MLLRSISFVLILLLAGATWASGVRTLTRTVAYRGKSTAVQMVVVDLRAPGVSVKVGLAGGHVGRTESLAGIAKRYGAVAAINGSFFDAYTKDALKNPDMSLISDGQLLFKSDLGSLLGFEADNTPHLGRVRFKLTGTLGKGQSWFAYWMNRKPTASTCVTIFNHAWGSQVQPMGGTSVVAEHGVVTSMTTGTPVAVPDDGFVIHFRGEGGLLSRFKVGQPIAFTPQTTVTSGLPEEWASVREAVGAGPRVLVQGQPVFDPRGEGFSDPKILTQPGLHSAAGFTRDGMLYLITARVSHVSDLGHILKTLGCTDGMNLDGGASSGLWCRGTYLTTPGRQISNALLILEQ